MKETKFKIYIEQLRKSGQEQINEQFPPDFLDVDEKDLQFKKPVQVKGQAYLAGDTLVLHLFIATSALIPCSICNEPVNSDIILEDFYHTEPLSEIKSGVFDYKEVLREAILLEAPAFAECNEGNCTKRKEIKKYLKEKQTGEEDGYRPFADL